MFASVTLPFTVAYDLWPFLLKGKGTDANIHHVGALWKALAILVWILGLESKTAPIQFQPAANQCARFPFIRPISMRGQSHQVRNPLLQIRLLEDVKITHEQLSYPFLTLLAEIGGYVGLFLGVSVNQISGLIEECLKRLCK